MKSEADGWIIIDMQNGKRVKKQAIPHRLEQFDAKDKLWKRFRDLSLHYFQFKHTEYIGAQNSLAEIALTSVDSQADRKLQRKDRCRDKVLYKWNDMSDFRQLSAAPAPSKPNSSDDTLRRRLIQYKTTHPQERIRVACDEILKDIERLQSFRYVPMGDPKERMTLQIALQRRLGGDMRDILEIIAEVKALLEKDEIF